MTMSSHIKIRLLFILTFSYFIIAGSTVNVFMWDIGTIKTMAIMDIGRFLLSY